MTNAIDEAGQERGKRRPFRRFLAHPLMLLPIGVVLVALGAILPGIAINALHIDRSSPLRALSGLLVGICGLLAYHAFQRWIVREPRDGVRPGRAGGELAAGVLGGVILFSLVVGAVALLGGLSIVGLRGTGDLWVWFGIAFYSGMVEEAVFRGVIQRQLEAVFGTWAALAVTSAFFGFAHLMNPGASLFAAFAIACEAGILLGAAYLVTRRLWAPIGLHMGWNFTQGWIWSIPVSGGGTPRGLVETRLSGPELLTGGAFGLEASGVALVVATIAGVALLRYAYRKGEFMPPRWKQGQTNE
ncbi:type II CAAX endopeptidase family protein [Novosphingobium resinovorum]|uniref:CPBP family intramembrane glutamic endopeptidase n=1 Tax=Novosphingobium TaxID=165696 RepID=UPI001B3C8B85|nr:MULTISPECIES: type II CAAX endopeptidase family protein [Novosphingobium]MBF7011644.1 CPBP family intramembrane metalloprotease [Novosphingobium sp. HR1a]WJM26399.1 type II CAAX endopeptidase family protein [Novosphingobium resinovorum]